MNFQNMNFSVSLDAREVLFHLNYMGYRNVTAIQLKEFMRGNFHLLWNFNFKVFNGKFLFYPFYQDLKKLMKYETAAKDSDNNSVATISSQKKLHEVHTHSSNCKIHQIKAPPKQPVPAIKAKDSQPRVPLHLKNGNKLCKRLELRKENKENDIPEFEEPIKDKEPIRPQSKPVRPTSAASKMCKFSCDPFYICILIY